MKKRGLVLGLILIGVLLISLSFVSAGTCTPNAVGWYSGNCWKCNSAGTSASTVDKCKYCGVGCSTSTPSCPSGNCKDNNGNCVPSGTIYTYSDGSCKSCCSGSVGNLCSCSGGGGGGGGGGTMPAEPAPTCGGDTPCGNYPACSAKKTWYLDADNDGYYIGSSQSSCNSPGTGWKNSATVGDCNDSNSGIKPGAIEICNGQDDNCDGSTDEGDVCIVVWPPFWANLKGQMISNSQAGDTVMMVAAGLGFNQDVNYSVYKNSTFLWFFHRISPLSQNSSSDLWTSSEPANGVYFIAKVASKQNSSGPLNIASINNAHPVADITSPVTGFFWSVNNPLSFTQNSYDEDDLLKLEWSFGDDTNQIINNYSVINSDLGNAVHNYTNSGIYTVKLKATEMTRILADEDSIKLYIFQEGINVVPIISNPADGISLGNFRIVQFNASTSFVANCTKGIITNWAFSAGDLNCSYIHAPNTKTYSGNYTIAMNWTLTTESSQEIIREYGDWSSRYNNVVEFTELFETGGKHTAYLDMSYESP